MRLFQRSPGLEKFPLITYQHDANFVLVGNWRECASIERNSEKVGGAYVFHGTRIPVRALFENLEDGATVDEFLEWFPGVGRHQVEAVLEFAAASLAEPVAA